MKIRKTIAVEKNKRGRLPWDKYLWLAQKHYEDRRLENEQL